MKNSKLTAGLSKEDKEALIHNYNLCSTTRKRLVDIINKKVKADTDKRLSASSYESPSWAYMQADSVGYQRALTEVLSLIED
jgi:hypothetical protein